jgi:hypothetical protein
VQETFPNGETYNLVKQEIKKLLDEFEKESVESADGRLRGLSESIWATLTLEERNVLTKYTQTYHYLNEPLRGLPYYGSKIPNAYHVHDLPILTKALSKFKMPTNTVVRRGVDDWTIKELGYGHFQFHNCYSKRRSRVLRRTIFTLYRL